MRKLISDAFETIGDSYIALRQKEIDAYIEEHKQEHDDAIRSSFFIDQKDPERSYRLSLLCANYTLYARKGEEALIVELSPNVALPYTKEEPREEKHTETTINVNPIVEKEAESVRDIEKIEETEEKEDPFANIKRRSFQEKLKKSSPDLKKNYKAIKDAALAKGLKGRVSKFADTYHLGRKTYLRITIAGKTLKCHFAISVKDYSDTAIPLEDVGEKRGYADTPSLLRVKSSLACRRAIKLISDMVGETEDKE